MGERQGIHRVQGKADKAFLEGVTILVLCPVVGLVPNLSKAEERSSNPLFRRYGSQRHSGLPATPYLPVGIVIY